MSEEGMMIRRKSEVSAVQELVESAPQIQQNPETREEKVPGKLYIENGQRVAYTPEGRQVTFGSKDEGMVRCEFEYLNKYPDLRKQLYDDPESVQAVQQAPLEIIVSNTEEGIRHILVRNPSLNVRDASHISQGTLPSSEELSKYVCELDYHPAGAKLFYSRNGKEIFVRRKYSLLGKIAIKNEDGQEKISIEGFEGYKERLYEDIKGRFHVDTQLKELPKIEQKNENSLEAQEGLNASKENKQKKEESRYHCPNEKCGVQERSGSKFCHNCGHEYSLAERWLKPEVAKKITAVQRTVGVVAHDLGELVKKTAGTTLYGVQHGAQVAGKIALKASYPILGNLSANLQTRLETLVGKENYNATQATNTSIYTNFTLGTLTGATNGYLSDNMLGAAAGGVIGGLVMFFSEVGRSNVGILSATEPCASLLGKFVSYPIEGAIKLGELTGRTYSGIRNYAKSISQRARNYTGSVKERVGSLGEKND